MSNFENTFIISIDMLSLRYSLSDILPPVLNITMSLYDDLKS